MSEHADWSWLWALPEERPHHPYSPSSLQNLEACPCYKNRTGTNERAVAGTLGHKVVETQEDDLKLSDKDFLAAAACADFVEQRRVTLQGSAVQEFKEIYLPIDDCKFDDCESTTAGYVDHLLLTATHAELIDYKFGLWRVEEAKNNLQGIAYSLGVFKRFPGVKTVRFWFFQPHVEYITDYTFTREQIPALYLRIQTVVNRAREARRADDFHAANPMVPTCNFCANLGRCPRILEFALRVAQKYTPIEFPSDVTPSKVLDPHNTKLALNLAAVCKSWAESFRRQTTDRVLRGEVPVPDGMRLQEMPGRRSITDMGKFKEAALRYVPLEVYESCLDATFGPIELYISENAPRGSKKARVEEFQAELETQGAITKGQNFTFLKAVSIKPNAE